MATSVTDFKIASYAAGFTIGFGFLTVWEAIKQTRRNKNPLRSPYIYMVWGEVLSNLTIGVVGWLFLDGVYGASVPVLFFLLLSWVFEVQLLMQIIINRIAIIAETPKIVTWTKWGTLILITLINIAVFCIWIPAHMDPPVSQRYVEINEVWDRTSKVLILIVDAGLNYYFLRTVKKRLVEQHGLTKYAPLVSFNAKLMVVSIAMDAMLIGLMSLPNQIVFIQFHPVTYMVKLNIEMSMASLILKLARRTHHDSPYADDVSRSVETRKNNQDMRRRTMMAANACHVEDDDDDDDRQVAMKSFTQSRVRASTPDDLEANPAGIQRRVDYQVTVSQSSSPTAVSEGSPIGAAESAQRQHDERQRGEFDTDFDTEDDVSLTHHAGHPRMSASDRYQ